MTDKLRQAAQQALDAIRSTEAYKYGSVMLNEAAEDLSAALEEQPAEQQGPVAWMMVNPTHLPHSMSLCWQPQNWHGTWEAVPLYTSPQPSKPWVGLTDEERRSIREWQRIQEELGPVWAPMMLYLYEAIEAKLKEKNNG